MSTLPTPIPLEVTPEDIQLAQKAKAAGELTSRCCAVVQAFDRTFPGASIISCGDTLMGVIQGGRQRVYDLSPELQVAVAQWPMTEPTSGTLTLVH